MLNSQPFFSIVTVTKNAVWSLMRTARSVLEQTFQDYEYIIVDSNSNDGTRSLISFWKSHGLLKQAISEPDASVYDAMNKGLQLANGRFVVFLNTNDTFASNDTLKLVHDVLSNRSLDGLLGWGTLNGQIWGSWVESEAFKLASLGFCHQALYVRRELLLHTPFDARQNKTDSDTLQLGELYAKGARIPIFPEVLAIRGGDPGISADLERTARSIRLTLREEYRTLSDFDIETIIAFRRRCLGLDAMVSMLDRLSHTDSRLALHVSLMVIDTLFLRQSRDLSANSCHELLDQALPILLREPDGKKVLGGLTVTQRRRTDFMRLAKENEREQDRVVTVFEQEEKNRIKKIRDTIGNQDHPPSKDVIVSLTTFPARLKTVSFAIESMFAQTHPPFEVHLWLGRDEIPNKNWLPKRLRVLEDRGLQIHFADQTHHHYDKFLHNADLNKDKSFVIFDDDVIYPVQSLRHLIDGQTQYPGCVTANRCHRIVLTSQGHIAPYSEWQREINAPKPSFDLFPTGAGGVLYPPGFLSNKLVTDIPKLLAIAPYADDIWLKVCAIIMRIPTYATQLSHKSNWYHRYTPSMREGSLMAVNLDRGLNDTQIRLAFEWLSEQRSGWIHDCFALEQRL